MTSRDTKREIEAALVDAIKSLQNLSLQHELPPDVREETRAVLMELHQVCCELDIVEPDIVLTRTAEIAAKIASFVDSNLGEVGYKSGTFQCKSDCDLCLSRAESSLEKALCYALFARCIAKG